MPLEGKAGPFELTFYDPVPTKMVPNDDLDLQVLWACKLDEMGRDVRVDRHVLADAWLNQVSFPWDEYGVAIRNLRAGLRAPFSGSVDNWFQHGMGAAIRSEVWACLAAGKPQLAAQYAYEDACVDHAGEGIWAEVFFAALQAQAFVERDPHALLRVALAQLPADSRIARAVGDTVVWWQQDGDWRQVRSRILDSYGEDNFTDVTMNVAFTILGWLDGAGDFGRAVCTAVNCGMDTDCTGATVGALMGIIDPTCIPEQWVRPIGRELVVDKRITGIQPPSTLDGFADLVLDLGRRLNGRAPAAGAAGSMSPQSPGPRFVELQPLDRVPTSEVAPEMNDVQRLAVDGYWAQMPAATWTTPALAVRYRFDLPVATAARVMFNTHQPYQLWLDGQPLIKSGGDVLKPSFHRAPDGQRADLPLAAGGHELIVVIEPPRPGEQGGWIWGVGDSKTHQWVPLTFA
jgi:ADP-ribosylglycohydrolase